MFVPSCPEVHDAVCRHVTANLNTLKPNAKDFLLALALILDDGGVGSTSMEELAKFTGRGITSLKGPRRTLKEAGVFECEERRAGKEFLRTIYTLSPKLLEVGKRPEVGIRPVSLIVDIDTETNLTPASREEETKTTTTSTPTSKSTPTSTPIESNIDILVGIRPVRGGRGIEDRTRFRLAGRIRGSSRAFSVSVLGR
jgi:hypothetical protein